MASEAQDPVSAALERLPAHLDDVEQDPSHPLDTTLFDTLLPFISPQLRLDQATIQSLVQQLARLLPQLQQDPAPVIQLLTKLIEPFDFDSIRSLQPPVDFSAGLDLAALPFHTLALSLLEKAIFSSRHAEFIASTPDIVSRLIQLWLATEDIGVADRAGHILFKLLQVDKDPADVLGIDSAPDANSGGHGDPTATVPSPGATASYGTGFMWKRVFGDKDVYSLFFALCGAEGPRSQSPPPSRSRKTVAQARLMTWLPKVGTLSWSAISHSHHPDIEESFGLKSTGLLDFISLHAVDYYGDVLMHISLMDFFSDLLKSCNQPSKSIASHHESIALEYLKSTGLHGRTLSYYIDPRSHPTFEVSYLYRPAANYLATYASTYPSDFETAEATRNGVLHRMMDVLKNVKTTQWAHGESPIHDLHVLSSLPRATIFPESESIWESCPLSLVPLNRHTNADALRTLATIFHGPDISEEITFPVPVATPNSSATSPARIEAESTAARSLYYLYTNENSSFASEIAQCADTLALKETALAALDFVKAVATANWSTTASSAISVPSEFPSHGLACILRAGNPILPCLLRPAPRFTNIVGGRGDAETTAYQVQARKFDTLKTIMRRLEQSADGDAVPGRGSYLDMIRERVAQGLWGRDGDVGGRIATLEM
ncbi:hypothetical protein IWZ03DRAFT_29731 [Phyllosticta citriasiana]|uniref:Uncharacterized protein n=1 Tax=Phyllosticta citriasiana TaxID=595635 RepID=A0ABR1L226_9PEZI